MLRRLPTTRMRNGATLVEVLMSLLIFSVGIVSVFTLFPVALLSSIQATKLTNSKILSDNVVELVRTNPGLLRPPGSSPTDDWKGVWKPSRSYATGDLIWCQFESGNLFPIPNIAYVCTSAGTSGGTEPTWLRSGAVNDGSGGLEWTPVTSNANYVVDPLGRFIDGTARLTFGYDNATPVSGGLPRTQGGAFTSYSAALPAFSLPDTWSVVLEEIPASVTATTVTFPSSVDLGSITATNHRVVLTAPDGETKSDNRRTAVRNIMSISGSQITLVSPNLPATLNSASEVGTVRIEAFNPRYSYFFTVRRPGPYEKPTVNAVVVFNRSYRFDDEEVYDANFGSSSYSDDSTVADGGLGTDQVKIAWDGENSAPLLREGNYIFDARNALWYLMTNIQRNDAGEFAIITLDRSVEVQTVDTGTVADSVGRAIFMPGIVKVFEL